MDIGYRIDYEMKNAKNEAGFKNHPTRLKRARMIIKHWREVREHEH
ncbi:hypothetical protein [Thermococcus henrietii]|nr:hypothetical protein [Thermococcus henrietii]